MANKPDNKAEFIPYTEAVKELDSILTEIEDADVDLDRLAGRVERASELVKLLKKRIRDTEMKVMKVVEELRETTDEPAVRGEPDDVAFDLGFRAGSDRRRSVLKSSAVVALRLSAGSRGVIHTFRGVVKTGRRVDSLVKAPRPTVTAGLDDARR